MSDREEDSDGEDGQEEDPVIAITEAGTMIQKVKKFAQSNVDSLLELMIRAQDLVERSMLSNLKQSTLHSL